MIEFYEDSNGRMPVLEWISHDLTKHQRRILGYTILKNLQQPGIDARRTAFEKQLSGLFEFRVRDKGLLLRVFCYAHDSKQILLSELC